MDIGIISNTVIASLGIFFIMSIIGMAIWYIKVKPDIEGIKKNLLEKAAATELVRIDTEIEQRKADKHQMLLKQNITECELQRKACQPLLLEQLKTLSYKIDELKEGQKIQASKLDRLMMKNGISTY